MKNMVAAGEKDAKPLSQLMAQNVCKRKTRELTAFFAIKGHKKSRGESVKKMTV